MFVFTPASTRKRLSPWGEEVQRILRERAISQDALCAAMAARGYEIDKVHLSLLLRGDRAKTRMPLILGINDYLGIPYDHSITKEGGDEDGKSHESNR